MKNSLITFSLIAAITSVVSNPLCAADTRKVICIETMKYGFNVPFTDETTIRQLKEQIQEDEGIPVEQQLLQKKEWARTGILLPGQVSIELEDGKTCAHYDLKNNDTIKLFLQLLHKQ